VTEERVREERAREESVTKGRVIEAAVTEMEAAEVMRDMMRGDMGSMMTGDIKTTQDMIGMGTQKDLVMTEIMIADTAETIEALKAASR